MRPDFTGYSNRTHTVSRFVKCFKCRYYAGIEDTLRSTDEFFSKREKEVLQLLASGYSSRDISEKLFITEKTVETHRKNLVQKAKVKNTVELIAYASMRGLIEK